MDYPRWQENVRTFFQNVHERLGLESRMGEATIHLKNDGTRSAEGLIVTFQAHGGLIFGKTKDASRKLLLPQPPTPPAGTITSSWSEKDFIAGAYPGTGLDLMKQAVTAQRPSPHDPFSFY